MISRIEEIALQLMQDRPMRGGFYSLDEAIRNALMAQADAAGERRMKNARQGMEYRKEQMTPEREKELQQAGLLQAALQQAGANTGMGMGIRGTAVGGGMTAGAAGLLAIMDYLQQGQAEQMQRNEPLTS
jgi:hypothetical protein